MFLIATFDFCVKLNRPADSGRYYLVYHISWLLMCSAGLNDIVSVWRDLCKVCRMFGLRESKLSPVLNALFTNLFVMPNILCPSVRAYWVWSAADERCRHQ